MSNPLIAELSKQDAEMDKAMAAMRKPAAPPPAAKQTPPPAAKEPPAPEPKLDGPVGNSGPDGVEGTDGAPTLDIDALLGGAPEAPKQDAPPPNDKEANLGFLRKSSEAAKREAEAARKEAEEARKEAEKLRAEMAKLDIAYDPVFTEKYEKPVAELAKKARLVGAHAGLKPEQIDQLVKTGLDLPRPQLKEMLKNFDADADTISTFMGLALDKTLLNEQRVEALRNHESTASEIRQQRLAQQAQRVQQLSAVRGEATKQGVRALLASDTTGFFKPTAKEDIAEVSGLIKSLPTVLDPAAGEDAVQHHARQVQVLTKGLAFDALARRNAELEQKYNALVQGVKSRGWATVEADTVVPKKDAPRTRAEILADDPDKDMKNFLGIVAARRGVR